MSFTYYYTKIVPKFNNYRAELQDGKIAILSVAFSYKVLSGQQIGFLRC